MKTLATSIGFIILTAAMIFCYAVIIAFPVQLLWNWVGVDVLGLKHITLFQAWGLLVLFSFLFKSSTSVRSE